MPALNRTAFQTVSDELKRLGLTLRREPGEYRVNFRDGTAAAEYITDDLQDALKRGREMARRPPAPAELPLGPLGRRTRKGHIYKHNRKLAARRKKAAARYAAAVAAFAENEDCSPVEAVPLNPRCIEIARQFNRTPAQVAKDINRVYLDSYSR